ncbi:MAG: hypothetical protein MJ106_07935, partial [Lentisphaeria bacterium]|nr:hypothetical protein [Lentisphaeria bacterium]
MKKTLLLTAFFSALMFFAQAKPLIAPVSKENWEPARNALAQSTFELTEENSEKMMRVSQDSDEGYTFYRTYTTLAPGDYTFIIQAEGKSEKGLLQNAYSFDAAGKPSLLFFHGTDGGVLSSAPIYITFTVPEGSVSQRFDVGISGNRGTATYWAPEIREGKISAPVVEETGFRAIPAAKGWIAEWIWFEGDKGVPGMDFTKEFELADDPTAAICEITVDNGYELVVNGASVGYDVDWHSVETYDLAPYLHKGKNSIVIHAKNTDGLAGVLFQAVIIDAAENPTVVKTDATWQTTHTDGTAATTKSFGETSATTGPWGTMKFHRITPPRALAIKPVNAVRETKAGGMLSFEFPLPPELDSADKEEFPELQIKYIDVKTGEAISISGVPLFVRCVFDGPKKTLWVEHLTSRYANPGTYRVEISGKDYVIHAGEVTVTAIDDLPEGSGALMPKPSLKNYLETDFYKQSLYVFAAENPSRETHISWSRTGGHFYELLVLTGTWSKEMLYDMTVIEKQMQDILEQDPLATVNLKFRIDVPGWWCAAHPEDVYLSKQGRSAQQSFCSNIWRKDSIQTIINTMEWLQKRPVGRA